ncbi:MAG: hypothetical protein WKG00_30390 [Polyangiaceae bacterium]
MARRTLPAARLVASLAAGAALQGVAPVARAQDSPGTPTGRIADTPLPKLEVTRSEGAEGCPGATSLADDLQQMVGRPAVDVEPGPGDGYRVDIARAPEGFEAVVRRRGEVAGERRIVDPDPTCQGLRETVSWPWRSSSTSRRAPRRAPARRASVHAPPAAPAPDLPPGPPLRGSVSAGAQASYELLDALAPVLFAELQLDVVPRFSVSAGVLWAPTEEASAGSGAVNVALIAGTARGCGHLHLTAPRVSGCLDLAMGQLRGEGVGYADTGLAHRFWMAAGASLDAAGAVYGPLGWTARLGVWVPLRHQKFAIEGADSVLIPDGYDTAPLAGVLGAGVQASIF